VNSADCGAIGQIGLRSIRCLILRKTAGLMRLRDKEREQEMNLTGQKRPWFVQIPSKIVEVDEIGEE
jgi:hypothetical protein